MVNRGTQGELVAGSPPVKSKPVELGSPRPVPVKEKESPPEAKAPKPTPRPKVSPPTPAPPKPDPVVEQTMEELQKQEDEEFMKEYEGLNFDDLIMKGYLEHAIDVTDSFQIKLRTLKKKEELDIKKRIASYDGVQMYVLDQVNVDTLCYALMEINSDPMQTTFETDEEFATKKARIEDLSEALVLEMLEEFRKLNRALVILIKGSSKNSLARRLLGQEFV